MTTDTALIEKREELKRRLAAGEYKTLVDVFIEKFDRFLRKIIRRTKPIPIWWIPATLSTILILTNFAVAYVTGITTAYINFFRLLGLRYEVGVLLLTLPGFLAIASPIAMNHYIERIITLWRDNMIDATESTSSLDVFEDWLAKTCNWRLHFLVTMIGGLFGGLYVVTFMGAKLGFFIGYGTIIIDVLISMFSSAFVYQLLMVVLLSSKLRRYDLKLFTSDPSSSELVSRLSGTLSILVYIIAFYAAFLTLIAAWGDFLTSFIFILVPGLWVPIIAIFILNQTSLSSIIRRIKWKTLHEIQAKVEKLQSSKSFGNQETMDAIKRLMDYHDRVKATRDSALDFRTYLSFINSLLLPLLAFILGNLDVVLKLIGINP
jgi:ABC-type multidrug transport system fused ATPase/permease subunit